jgi:hypothetical protein
VTPRRSDYERARASLPEPRGHRELTREQLIALIRRRFAAIERVSKDAPQGGQLAVEDGEAA